jgi:hypothetical protein
MCAVGDLGRLLCAYVTRLKLHVAKVRGGAALGALLRLTWRTVKARQCDQ